ncbi:hypothetical protein EDC04DRAFT_2863722 [Pisolithus marmoratus]|nr:hypothetical protein EDC04DRAFT_2863722 [Pisolithus marmoratus]
MRGYRCLILSIPILLPHKIYQREDVPPRQTQNHNGPSNSQMTVLQQQYEATGWDGECTWLEQCGTPVLPWDVPREDAGSGSRLNSNAMNSSAICSHRAEEKLLANNGVLPKLPLTGISHLP